MRAKYFWPGPILLVVLATACGGSAVAEDTTTTSVAADFTTTIAGPTTTTAETTTTSTMATTTTTAPPVPATPFEDVVGGTSNGVGWLAPAGAYAMEVDGRTVRLDMSEPFTYIESEVGVLVAPVDIPDNGFQVNLLAIMPFVAVMPAHQVAVHQPHDPVVPEVAEPMPDDLSTWLDTLAQVTYSAAPSYEGSDFSAMGWEISVDPSAGDTFPCDYGDCLGVLVNEVSGVWVWGNEFEFHLWQFDGAGSGLYGFGQAPVGDSNEAEAFYQAVLDGLTFSD